MQGEGTQILQIAKRQMAEYDDDQSPRNEASAMRLGYAIVFVGDMKKSVAFYRDVLGLPLRFESPHWTEFATEGATLALHVADGSANGNDSSKKPAGICRPGLAVSDLDSFHKRLIDQGVPCVQEPKEVFGARIAQYLDPDGLPISISEERRGRG